MPPSGKARVGDSQLTATAGRYVDASGHGAAVAAELGVHVSGVTAPSLLLMDEGHTRQVLMDTWKGAPFTASAIIEWAAHIGVSNRCFPSRAQASLALCVCP